MTTWEAAKAQEKYEAFLDSIDVTQAGTDEYGDLRWHVDCSALANACDEDTEEAYYKAALATAEVCLEDWRSMYPQLVICDETN